MTVHLQSGYEANILTINAKSLSRDGRITSSLPQLPMDFYLVLSISHLDTNNNPSDRMSISYLWQT